MSAEETEAGGLPEGVPAVLSPEAEALVRQLQEEMEARGDGKVSVHSKWWGFEVHLDAAAAKAAAEITDMVGQIVGAILGGAIGTIVEYGMKIKAKLIKEVGGTYGCRLVSPWFSPGMLIPVPLGGKDDTNLWWTVFEPGRPSGQEWSGSTKFVENLTKANPALAEFQGKLICAHVGDGDPNLWWTVYDPNLNNSEGGWGPSKRIGTAFSSTGPALAVYNNKLHMVHKGNGDNNLWHATFDGTKWSSSTRLSTYSSAAPALAVYRNALHLVHKGNGDSKLWHLRYTATGGWSGLGSITTTTSSANPGLAVHNDQLHLIHRGNGDTDLWHLHFNGSRWQGWGRVPGAKSKEGPALFSFKGDLYCVARGASSGQSLWWTRHNGGGWSQYKAFPQNFSNASPALIVYRDKDGTKDQLLCVHRGSGTSGFAASFEEPETEPVGTSTP